MPTFIAGLVLLYLLLAAIKQFGRMTPADAARLMRKGGLAMGVLGLLLTLLRGRFGFAGMLASAFLGLSGRGGPSGFSNVFRGAGFGAKRGPRASAARSAAIEMRLDLGSRAMEGRVLSGPWAGQELAALTRSQCLDLLRWCLSDDPDGAVLLETYLDRRFAGWREANQGQSQRGSSPLGGAMSRDEAYEILGLAKGSGTEEIVRAHRSLMKKLHPDHGGSTALAARVNQAKDVLLDRHG